MTARRLVLALLLSLLSTFLVSTASANPVEQCNDNGTYQNGGYNLWLDAWLKAGPLDPNGTGLHKFNSVGCEGYTIAFFKYD